MEKYRLFDPVPVSDKNNGGSFLSAVLEAFRRLDDVTGQNISSRVTIEGTPFPEQRLIKPYDISYHGVNIKWMRIFCRSFDGGDMQNAEEVVLDLQEEPLLIHFDIHAARPGYAVCAAYHACCIALLAQEERPSPYRSGRGTQKEYINEACATVRKQLLRDGLPYLDLIRVSDGEAVFSYMVGCRLHDLLFCLSPDHTRYARKILRAEYADLPWEEANKAVGQAVEMMRNISPEDSGLCAVPYYDGMHGRALHGHPRVSFVCAEPESFLKTFRPETYFSHAFGQSLLASEDPTADENIPYIRDAAQAFERPFAVPENVLLLPADEAYYARLLGMDVSCLCKEERFTMTAEIILAQALSLLGLPHNACETEEENRNKNIHFQLSAFYQSLSGCRSAGSMFLFGADRE